MGDHGIASGAARLAAPDSAWEITTATGAAHHRDYDEVCETVVLAGVDERPGEPWTFVTSPR